MNLDEVTKTNPNSLKIKKLGFFVFKKFHIRFQIFTFGVFFLDCVMNKVNFLFNYFTKENYERKRKGTRFQNPLKNQ